MRTYIAGVMMVSMLCISVIMLIVMVGEAGCVARTVNGGVCPANTFALLNFHMSAFSKLTQTLISLFVSFCIVIMSVYIVATSTFSPIRYRAYIQHAHSAHHTLQRWIAIHETSPTRGERA